VLNRLCQDEVVRRGDVSKMCSYLYIVLILLSNYISISAVHTRGDVSVCITFGILFFYQLIKLLLMSLTEICKK